MSNRSYVRPGRHDDAACDVFHLHPGKVAALKRALIAEDSVGALADQHIVKLFEQGLEHVQEPPTTLKSQVSRLNSASESET